MSAERRSRYLRVVRPGSGAGSDAATTPPLPVEPPLTPPIWLDPPQVPPHVPTQTPTRGASGGPGSGQAGGLPGGSTGGAAAGPLGAAPAGPHGGSHDGSSDGSYDGGTVGGAPHGPLGGRQASRALPTQAGSAGGPTGTGGSGDGSPDGTSGWGNTANKHGAATHGASGTGAAGFGESGGCGSAGQFGTATHGADGASGTDRSVGGSPDGAGGWGSAARRRGAGSAGQSGADGANGSGGAGSPHASGAAGGFGGAHGSASAGGFGGSHGPAGQYSSEPSGSFGRRGAAWGPLGGPSAPRVPGAPSANRAPGAHSTAGAQALFAALRAQDSFGAGVAGGAQSAFGEDPVETALRASLHEAVVEIRPAADSLARLRRAVPQRRALKRRAYAGAAVAASLALFGLTALHSLGPDAVTSAETGPAGPGLPGVHPSATAHGRGTAGDPSTPGAPRSGSSVFPTRSHGNGGVVLVPLPSGGVTTVATAAAGHSLGPAATLAECTRTQLGNGAAGVAPADSSGIVYGSFAVSNVSTTPCKVSNSGSIDVVSPVGTDRTHFAVTAHTAGDPAVSLPAPDPTHPAVALAPGQSYVVDFAFVPAPCGGSGTTGPTGTATAAPATPGSASAGATGSGSTAGAAATPGDTSATPGGTGGTSGGSSGGASGTGGTGNPSPTTPSVQLASVPASGGSVAASTTIQGACAGTIYRTDPLAAPR